MGEQRGEEMVRRLLEVTMVLGVHPGGGARAGAADEMATGSGNWNYGE